LIWKERVTNKKTYHHGDLKNALIEAGIEILASEGVHALSLRKVAQRAGVSHAAPYAHFADKQALIAAISTAGYQKVQERLERVWQENVDDPLRLLVRTAWEYVQFAVNEPAHFKITFSGFVEKEQDYPALVEATQKTFGLLRQIVAKCQEAGVMRLGPTDLAAVSIWGAIHGLVTLRLEGQVPHTALENRGWQELLIFTLAQLVQVPIPKNILSEE
jgi:AcrR family transcriptional regulator